MTKTIPARILVEEHPNPQCRDVHTTAQICEKPYQNFQGPLRDTSERYLGEVGGVGAKLVRGLFQLNGVTEVSLSPYSFTVTLGKAFRWSDYDGDLVALVKQCFPCREDEIQVSMIPRGGSVQPTEAA